MLLLTPVLLVVVMGSIIWRCHVSEASVRPLLPYGAMGIILFSWFNSSATSSASTAAASACSCSAAPRAATSCSARTWRSPPSAWGWRPVVGPLGDLAHAARLLAGRRSTAPMYLLFCMLANWMSILVPIPVRASSSSRSTPRRVRYALQVAVRSLLAPLALLPAMLPYGVDFAVAEWGGVRGLAGLPGTVPVGMPGGLLLCTA